MKIETMQDGNNTIIGYFREGKVLDIIKCWDGRTFYRVDYNSHTISSLNRTKAEALKEARKYIAKNFK